MGWRGRKLVLYQRCDTEKAGSNLTWKAGDNFEACSSVEKNTVF